MYTIIQTGVQYQTLTDEILDFEAGRNFTFAWYSGQVEIDDNQQVVTIFTQEQVNEAYDYIRKYKYTTESDPLFFKYQLGLATEADWIAARDNIQTEWETPII